MPIDPFSYTNSVARKVSHKRGSRGRKKRSVITKVPEKDPGLIKRKIYYGLVIFTLQTSNFFIAFCEFSVSTIFNLMADEYQWSFSGRTVWLGVTSGVSVLGLIIGFYTYFMFFNRSHSYQFLWVMKLLIFVSLAASMIENVETFIICKILFGIFVSYAHRKAIVALKFFTHRSHRKASRNVGRIMYTLGMLSCFVLSSIVYERNSSWRLVYLAIMSIAILDMMIFSCFVGVNFSPYHLYKLEGREKAEESAKDYLHPKAVIDVLEDA